MSYAVSDMVLKVRRILQEFPFEGTITANYTASGTSITVNDGTDWAQGDVLEFPDTGDQYLVQSVASNVLTVLYDYNGTDSVSHSTGDRVVKNPVFGYQMIVDAASEVISTLWPKAWIVDTFTISPTSGQYWYNLDVDVLDVVQVSQAYGDSSQYIAFYGVDTGLPIIQRNQLTPNVVGSGTGIMFPSGFYHPTNDVTVVVRKKLTATVTGGEFADLSLGIGADTVANGIAAKLVADREASRVVFEDVSQGDASVQPGAKLRTAAYYEGRFERLLGAWFSELWRTARPMATWS